MAVVWVGAVWMLCAVGVAVLMRLLRGPGMLAGVSDGTAFFPILLTPCIRFSVHAFGAVHGEVTHLFATITLYCPGVTCLSHWGCCLR